MDVERRKQLRSRVFDRRAASSCSPAISSPQIPIRRQHERGLPTSFLSYRFLRIIFHRIKCPFSTQKKTSVSLPTNRICSFRCAPNYRRPAIHARQNGGDSCPNRISVYFSSRRIL